MSLVRADGFVRVPAMSEGLGAGAPVEVALLRTKEEIEHTVGGRGSHDNLLEILANRFRRRYPRFSIASASRDSATAVQADTYRDLMLDYLDSSAYEGSVSLLQAIERSVAGHRRR